MPNKLKKQQTYFSKVRYARELLREKSQELLEEYLDVVKHAKEAGDYETAAKALQWLIDHMPADEDGGRIVEQSVDKKQQVVEKQRGPEIKIGIAVGGLGENRKALPKPDDGPVVTVIDNE